MIWFIVLFAVLAMGGIAMVAAGRGTPMADDFDDRPDALVPAEGRLGSADLRRVRFSLTLRGYRMSEVDALLDRLAREREDDERRAAWSPDEPEEREEPEAPAAPEQPEQPEQPDDGWTAP